MNTDKLREALDACRQMREHGWPVGTAVEPMGPWLSLIEALAEMALADASGDDSGPALPSEPEPRMTYRALAEGEVFLPRNGSNPESRGVLQDMTAIGAAWDKTAGGKLTRAMRYPDGHVEVTVIEEPDAAQKYPDVAFTSFVLHLQGVIHTSDDADLQDFVLVPVDAWATLTKMAVDYERAVAEAGGLAAREAKR